MASLYEDENIESIKENYKRIRRMFYAPKPVCLPLETTKTALDKPRLETIPLALFGDKTTLAISTINEVLDHFGAGLSELMSSNGGRYMMQIRQIVYWRLRDVTGATYSSIGKVVGGKAPETVMLGIRAVDSIADKEGHRNWKDWTRFPEGWVNINEHDKTQPTVDLNSAEGVIKETAKNLISPHRALLTDVACKYKTSVNNLFASSYEEVDSFARHVSWWRIHNELCLSLPRIAMLFNRKHTTIYFGIKKINWLVNHYGVEVLDNPSHSIRLCKGGKWRTG